MAPQLRLAALPLSARVILTAFLGMIGFGYLSALGNLYAQHELADGRPGLSLDDLRAVYQGVKISRAAGEAGPASGKSRMLTMVEPGGKMRKHLEKGGDASVRALTTWLTQGASASRFEQKGLTDAADPSARAVIERQCLKCHNAEDGERKKDPFGPDGFDADFAMVSKYTTVAAGVSGASLSAQTRVDTIAPQTIPHLLLIAHIHMLSIPIFTLIIGLLFLGTGWSPRLRGFVAAVPMVALAFDFASWWIARWFAPTIYVIAAAGTIYGLFLGVQLVAVFGSMWLGRTRAAGLGGYTDSALS